MPEAAEDEADNPDTSPSGWTLQDILDIGAALLLAVVLFRAVGGVVAAVSTPTIPVLQSGLLGQPGNSFVPDLSTYERLQYASGWGDLVSGVLLVMALLAVAIPRIVWDTTDQSPWTRRSIALLGAVAGVAVLTMAAAGVTIYNIVDHPGVPTPFDVTLEESGPVAEAAGALLLAAIVVAGSWIVWRFWGPPTDRAPAAAAPAD